MDSVVQYENKLKKLLTKFLVPGYRIGNDVYLNILLSHLSGKNNKIEGEQLRRLPIFCEWLEQAVVQWENTLQVPSPSISTFTLNLSSLISTDETNFVKLNSNNVYLRLCKVLQLRSNENTPSIKLGYLKMLMSFMNHKSGLDWLMSTDCWNDILQYCLENQTIYITREGYMFMYELLNKFVDINETFCELIVKKLIACLEPDQFNKNGIIKSEIDDFQIQKDLTPTLKLVTHILEKSYMSDQFKISNIFLNKYNLENNLWNLLMVARDSEFVFTICKLIFLIDFIRIDRSKFTTRDVAVPELKNFGRKFSNLFNTLVNKECSVNILKLSYLGHSLWAKTRPLVPPSEKKDPIIFENQIIIFQIMPLLFLTFASADKNELREDELTDIFINKLFKISCEHTIRLAYSYRSLLMASPLATSYDVAQKSIFYLMKVRQHFHRDRAVIVFQALMYAMRYLSKALINNKTHTIVELQANQVGFLSALFDGLKMLIKDFKITWTESVESICLTSLTIDFLNCLNLPNKLTVSALQLMHLTIVNFMPPNMALLVNDVNGSSVQTITPMLYKRLHDLNWEVRDSALEILQTIAEISHIKFPAFQKLVIDDHLCQLAVILSTEDPESFVRASAIKANTVMIKVPLFWTDSLENEQLLEKMMSILETESEALVRCEAAKLICELYEHQLIPSDTMHLVYAALTSAATYDLHWEVKVNALDFWDKVISIELSNQGMIDGAFPSVTFSKEHKKIVTLTEPEIRNRLNKVLINLSDCGCLAVLITTMQDSCDLQVAKKSVEITKKLSEQLKKYNMLSNVHNINIYQGVTDVYKPTNISLHKDSTEYESDAVIDAIVNCTDMNLLANVFQTQMKTNQINGDVKNIKVVEPEFFKSFIVQDLDSLINDRSNWLDSVDDLNSLLDDILQSYEENDINSMDCY